jgi:glutaredoxin 3
MSARVRMYTTTVCPYCIQAKALLKKKGVAFEEINVGGDPETREWLVKTTGRRTVPQIFINDEPIGGYDDMRALDLRGELDKKLEQTAA